AENMRNEASFNVQNMEGNAFILFGMPNENLSDVVNTMFYASERVGGIVPMLFTPVPGSIMFEQYRGYLFEELGFDLHHLNGKLYPFLRYNFERKRIRLEDYVALESLAFRLNAKAMGKTFGLTAENRGYRARRKVLAGRARVESAAMASGDQKGVNEAGLPEAGAGTVGTGG